jgi:allantoinase
MKEGDDFFAIWGGIAGCQSTLAALLTAGRARGLPLPTLAALVAGNVARRFALPRKGALAVGADADLALVDLERETIVEADDLLYRHRMSPYVGRRFRGRVVRTILRGRTIARDGRIVAAPRGELVRPRMEERAGSA